MVKINRWYTSCKQLTREGKAAHEHLSGLKTWQLKHLTRVTGVTPGKKKSGMAGSILSSLDRDTDRQSCYKSVDMGVKNLAVCVVKPNTMSKTSSAHFTLHYWDRSDVLKGDRTDTCPEDEDAVAVVSETETMANSYSPSNLAPHAARIALGLRTEFDPSHILVERQRFRSKGGSAVQEWTLRVNSLEAMLWASVETLKQEQRRGRELSPALAFPIMIEMSPARVAAFWNGRGNDWSLEDEGIESLIPDAGEDNPKRQKQTAAAEQASKRGMEKSEKIALVRSWLQNGALDVKEPLEPLANAFMQTGRAKKTAADLILNKKDDLADSCVQGVTFALWQRNRQRLSQHLSGLLGLDRQ